MARRHLSLKKRRRKGISVISYPSTSSTPSTSSIPSIAFFFLAGFDWLRKLVGIRLPWLNKVFRVGGYLLLAAYGLDVLILVLQLASVRGLL